jgi:segregation and condensation protein A
VALGACVRMALTYKLTDFEGPLDLLLHLVRETKLEIKFVPLSSVTEQFLKYMEEIDTVDFNSATEFIEIAATLVEIKSRGILPKSVTEDEEEDIESKLKAQLEEYKILKEASEKLKEQENIDHFYKTPIELKPEFAWKLDNLSLDILTAAFSRIMHRMAEKAKANEHRQIRLDRFTVRDKILDIKSRIKHNKQIMFFDLFESDFTKSEMINTFLALLELLKSGEICALQESKFSDILIREAVA